MAKEIMNLYTWTIGASHTPAAFMRMRGPALPFDVTDTVASLLFGLAFGPELARLLARTRARMDVQWEPVAGTPAHAGPIHGPSAGGTGMTVASRGPRARARWR